MHAIQLSPMRNCLKGYWTLSSSFSARMLRNYLVPLLLQLLLPPNSTSIIATILDRPTTLNNGSRIRVQALHHNGTKVNYVARFTEATNSWIVDSGATHHITTELHNLQPYRGNEDVSMGDGSENVEATGAQSDQQWTV
ncbi:hypothetical protein KY289_000585 [Solanum tuberosum]|nr:hypothetical protein KY289_000585 [Solanum tuberosum]